jgi:7,8-dihydroneopterin aldolase/epimerase/oxygenase
MSDRIVLAGMRFEGRHGVSDDERAFPQLLEVDLEVELDLRAAGASDELADTVDYGALVSLVGRIVEGGSFRLLEAIAGSIATDVLREAPAADGVIVRVRKLAVPLDADLDHAAVHIERRRIPPGA